MRVYIDTNDWWVGYYRGDTHHYVCPIPTVVIRWNRRVADPSGNTGGDFFPEPEYWDCTCGMPNGHDGDCK